MNLYELTTQMQAAMDALVVNEETGEVSGFEAVDALDVAFDDKAESYAIVIKNLLAEAEAIHAESEKLRARENATKRRAESLKMHLAQSMAAVGKEKLVTARAALSFRKSQSVRITNEDALPEGWWKVSTKREPDKVAIAKQLKAGIMVPGAELETKLNLQVK